MYKCGWDGCEKAYGTLTHLNAHVFMQSHGQKRTFEGKMVSSSFFGVKFIFLCSVQFLLHPRFHGKRGHPSTVCLLLSKAILTLVSLEFKDMRKEWKQRKKEEELARKAEERQRQAAATPAAQDRGADPQANADGTQPPISLGSGIAQLPPIGY